jgi:hypothetical protein
VGAALLSDAFGHFWERGEHSVGLGVDAASDTGAFRLYERAGMAPVLGWVMYDRRSAIPLELRDGAHSSRRPRPQTALEPYLMSSGVPTGVSR